MSTKKLFTHYKQDLPSGLVVFLVALPLCLGIALASGAPLFAGIIAGIVGGIVIGSLSGSSVSVSGPAAGLTVIVLSAIEELGSFQVFLLAVVLEGVLQLFMGALKLGILSHYIPSSVIKGLLAAIGLTLIIGSIPQQKKPLQRLPIRAMDFLLEASQVSLTSFSQELSSSVLFL